MQADLDTTTTGRPIRILGLNGIGQESGNPLIVAGNTIPWLQDTAAQDVWNRWKVTYRDVIVLHSENNVAGIYNLSDHNLALASNYEALKTLLIEVSNEP